MHRVCLPLIIALLAACNPTEALAPDVPETPTAVAPDGTSVAFATAMKPGIPFGAFGAMNGDYTPSTLRLDFNAVTASNIDDRIAMARSRGYRMVLAMTGGDHDNYMSKIDGVYQFDRNKWNKRMQTFNTSAIRSLVAKAVQDGVVIGNSVMDEPNVYGSGGGNTWGPKGTMTKAKVDDMCAYVKNIFPTLPTGVVHKHSVLQPDRNYYKCDFLADAYSARFGSVSNFRDAALAFGARSHVSILFMMNVINGGTQDKDGNYNCDDSGFLKGTRYPNCQMTASQLKTFGLALGPKGCALNMWKYDDAYMRRSSNRDAFTAIANQLDNYSRKPCKRT